MVEGDACGTSGEGGYTIVAAVNLDRCRDLAPGEYVVHVLLTIPARVVSVARMAPGPVARSACFCWL